MFPSPLITTPLDDAVLQPTETQPSDTQPSDTQPSDFGTDDENLDFGSASGEDLPIYDETDAVTKSEPPTVEEPVVQAPSAPQLAVPAVAPFTRLIPLPEITGDSSASELSK